MIHSTAVIHPKAQMAADVVVGPYAVIDEHVIVGPGCVIGPHVHLTGHTEIGARNEFHTGCVMGDAPQDLKYDDEPTRLRIGEDNVFREHSTVNRANGLEEDTVIGSNNFLMINSHVGHNVVVGSSVIIANGVLIAGHAIIEDNAFLSANCLVHQFVRVGRLALMQGGSGISKDLPPFCVARGGNGICGLNSVGLRRAGYSADQRLELKRLYHILFRSRLKRADALSAAEKEFTSEPCVKLLRFVAETKRGVCGAESSGVRHGKSEEPD